MLTPKVDRQDLRESLPEGEFGREAGAQKTLQSLDTGALSTPLLRSEGPLFPPPVVSGTPKKNSPKRLGLAALYPPGSHEDAGPRDFRVSFGAWVFELELVSLGLLPSPLSPFPFLPGFCLLHPRL